jgi:Tol biopolymer transport system component
VTLAAGTKLGPYEVLAMLGAGGMGEVYKARDTRLDRTVAIKVLPANLAIDPAPSTGSGSSRARSRDERRARFEREAKTISQLNHPHICTLHDVGVAELPSPESRVPSPISVSYLVMEHLEGDTLADRLRQGPLPLPLALECGAQIADALAWAHRQGIVHRDLKPANIMLLKAGARAGSPQIKLLDFGLAQLKTRTASGTGAPTATHTAVKNPGTVMGTVPYMAPEQLEGSACDARTDLFALGCVLYELLTARRAFQGASEASVISAILSADPPPVSALQPLTPPALDRLVRRCLAKDPEARWQHAADVAEELRGISADSVSAPQAHAARPRRHRAWVVAAASAVLLLAAVAATWVAYGRFARRPPESTRFALTMPVATALEVSASSNLAVAADGSGVVYSGRSGGRTQLYWHDLHGPDGWALAGTEGGTTPFLSPDGRWLGFFRDGKLLALPLQAGRVIQGSPVKELAATDAVRGATWSDDGTIVYGVLAGGLWAVAADGDQARQVTEPDRAKEADHRFPSFLPGGREVLFTVQHASNRQDRSAIAALSIETGRRTDVLNGGVYARYVSSGHLVFGRSGTLLAVPFDVKTLKVTGSPVPVLSDVSYLVAANSFNFDIAARGTLVYAHSKAELPGNSMVWVTRDGDAEPALPDRRAYESINLALSPDGQRLATTIDSDSYSNIWIWDLRDRRWQQLSVEADCYTPVWSPAGDRIAFSSNLDGALNLYVMAANGESPPVRVGTSRTLQRPRSWSPDGRFLAYEVQTPGTIFETHVLQVDGRASPWRWGPEGAEVSEPAFSPDGRWLAYQSRESGRWEVWVRPFPGPGPRQLVSGRDGGFAPVWDGSEIYYLERLTDTRIMSRRVESTSPLRLAANSRVAFALPFALSGGSAYLSQTYVVEPGGRRVLVVRPDERDPNDISALNVITNWPEEVKKELRARQ